MPIQQVGLPRLSKTNHRTYAVKAAGLFIKNNNIQAYGSLCAICSHCVCNKQMFSIPIYIQKDATLHSLYESDSNENLKYFYLVVYWTQMYTMTSCFYVVSIVLHTSVPALRKCMHTSKKNSFGWECSHSCTACCTSSSDLKDLSPIVSLSGPKTWKSLGLRSGEYGGCGRHSKGRLGLLQRLNGQYGTEHCHVGAKHLYSDVHVFWTWLQETGDSLGRSAYVVLVKLFPLGM